MKYMTTKIALTWLIMCSFACHFAWAIELESVDTKKEVEAGTSNEAVIVLHGIARDNNSMSYVAKVLTEKGYAVHNLSYLSTEFTFEELREQLHTQVRSLNLDEAQKVHFVGYSMGSLMIRLYLEKYRPENLGRVVMIAPPNQGSEVADFFKDDPVFIAVMGKAGQRLGVKENGIATQLSTADFDVGIIAGDRSVDPLSSAIIPGEDDGKVSIESTKLEGMNDHIVVHASHLFIIVDELAIQQVAYYLQHGKFKR